MSWRKRWRRRAFWLWWAVRHGGDFQPHAIDGWVEPGSMGVQGHVVFTFSPALFAPGEDPEPVIKFLADDCAKRATALLRHAAFSG